MKYRLPQRGAVLIVSLLILLVLTVIGVAGLTNTSLEERMSHNFQHDMLAFQAAESANQTIMASGDEGGTGTEANPYYVEASDSLKTAITAGLGATTTVVTHDMDPNNFLGNASLTTSSTVSWIGVSTSEGGDSFCAEHSGSKCYRFQLTTTAGITESGTSTTHIQGVERAGAM